MAETSICSECNETIAREKVLTIKSGMQWACAPCAFKWARSLGLLPDEVSPLQVSANDAGDEITVEGVTFKFS